MLHLKNLKKKKKRKVNLSAVCGMDRLKNGERFGFPDAKKDLAPIWIYLGQELHLELNDAGPFPE